MYFRGVSSASQVRASINLITEPVEVRKKRRAAERMTLQEREAVADAILGVWKGEESHSFKDLLARAPQNPNAETQGSDILRTFRIFVGMLEWHTHTFKIRHP